MLCTKLWNRLPFPGIIQLLHHMNWKYIQDQYPVNMSTIWLNNAGTTPCGTIQQSAVKSYLEEYSKLGIFSPNFSYTKIKSEIISILAKLLNVQEKNLALIHNTSEGLNLYSLGLKLNSGDSILLLENEYPSNYYPWEHWLSKNVNILKVPMQYSPDKYFDSIESMIDSNSSIRILSLSPIHWCTGIPLPIQKIADLCKSKGIKLVLDGAQGIGHIPLNLSGLNVHFMAASSWKWLLGPLGLGVLYISDEALDTIEPVFKGTQSVIDDSQYLPYKVDYKKTADRYEYSTSSFLDWVYFHSSLKMLAEIGFDQVQNQIYSLSNYFFTKLKENGFKTTRDQCTHIQSGVVGFVPKNGDVKEIQAKLFAENIIVAERLGNIRVSAHIYNSIEQLDMVLDKIL
ncbi:aminotransferase class V-fold PLP-dependent enzyme [Leptospira sp. GIMC2001]|uniref:aminotransferase class V-fold PLP-dependent enzyme n=1 Tax=Leptospira sp. GIMC2001 TaxID=1513297 RepID=UPI00234B7020|nr:aminotransferase class V-fold PLP-dependent enzyme [Leptospira sp. GIMC2001]WCL47810.1 aminotransferase class V-fold PLP-dependent enzyme [Leptospira sp. GIMC2001]